MGLWKRGDWGNWMDAWVHGHRYREPLGTTDWREAKRLERERVEQLEGRATVPTPTASRTRRWTCRTAITAYAEERRAQVSTRMAAYWLENARPSQAFFKDTKLRHIAPAQLAAYQNARTDAGRAPKTINGELSVLRQILKRAKLWYRFADDYTHATQPQAAGRPGADAEEQERLFALARTRPTWLYAYVATTLVVLLRAAGLRDQGAELAGHRSRQSAAARAPVEDAGGMAVADVEHDVPRGRWRNSTAGRHSWASPSRRTSSSRGTDANKHLDPTQSDDVLAHGVALDAQGRRTDARCASTMAATRPSPRWRRRDCADWVIQAQVGHVAPAMMKTYSHIRRQALNAGGGRPGTDRRRRSPGADTAARDNRPGREGAHPEAVMSHATSQSTAPTGQDSRIC